MAAKIAIVPEPARLVAMCDEARVIGEAVARNPENDNLRARLAGLLIELDEFDRVIDLLGGVAPSRLASSEWLKLAKAAFSRRRPGDLELAEAAAAHALESADSEPVVALALSELAKADFRRELREQGVDRLEQALELDPACRLAFKRLSRELLRRGDCARALEVAEGIWSRGLHHTRALAVRTIALARLGRIEEARVCSGIDSNVTQCQLPAPPGWADLASFNRRLADELLQNPGLRFDRYGVASQNTFRVDTPQMVNAPAVSALIAMLAERVSDHVSSMGDYPDLWREARPERAQLQSWSVHAQPDGYEEWHIHPHGWMSGGYYVDVPTDVVRGSDERGCIAFGLPGSSASADVCTAFGTRVLRPQPGSLVLFPSQLHHRTFAHQSSGRRICLAFDIVPH
ncbi:MAG: hypothetical protein IE933_14450 [Sphingomonadales bacterium]|nr:hypothetical protein [Sphingomonadales bacterium]MBD3772423.1 hypothetical protein [Paracoccaceae bacterium]